MDKGHDGGEVMVAVMIWLLWRSGEGICRYCNNLSRNGSRKGAKIIRREIFKFPIFKIEPNFL